MRQRREQILDILDTQKYTPVRIAHRGALPDKQN